MSLQLINHSPDLSRLVQEGYAIRIEGAWLIVEEIPYLDSNRQVCRGAFVCPLDANGERAIAPSCHIMSFAGGMPHDRNGKPHSQLGSLGPSTGNVGSLHVQRRFSNKPRGPAGPRRYTDYYEKVTTYERLILTEVHTVDPSATAKVGALPAVTDGDPFTIPDSASARAGISDLAELFSDEVVGIIGLGGTGSYIADHVAKVPTKEDRYFDGDRFFPHNVFKAPGAPTSSELQPAPFKAEYHAARNRLLKKNVIAHPLMLDRSNVHLLDGVTFAFVAMDPGPQKAAAINYLENTGISFVEVGMGLHKRPHGIGGTLRAVLSTPGNRETVRPRIPVGNPSQELVYTSNIQVSDLNSQNANMAIQLWKGSRGFYITDAKPVWIYLIDTCTLIREAA